MKLPSSLCYLGLAASVYVLTTSSAWSQAADASFSLPADGVPWSMAIEPAGSILIAGPFETLGTSTTPRLARLKPTGEPDHSFEPAFIDGSGPVLCLSVQRDSKILVGGWFTISESAGTRTNLARLLPNGALDLSFNAEPDGDVTSLIPDTDGRVIVAGNFHNVNGISNGTAHGLLRLSPDGHVDSSFGTAFIGPSETHAVVRQTDRKLVVAGPGFSFSTPEGPVMRRGLARLTESGDVDTTFEAVFAPNYPVTIESMTIDETGKILIGGFFWFDGESEPRNFARLNQDGTTDSTFIAPQTAFGGDISSIAVQSDGKILIGGSYGFFSGGVDRSYLSRLNPDGSLDTSFNANPDNAVAAVAFLPDGKLLVGGQFDEIGGKSEHWLARLVMPNPLQESISVNSQNAIWMVTGDAPMLYEPPAVEISADNLHFELLGKMTRSAYGWGISMAGVTPAQSSYVRLRATVVSTGGLNGGEGSSGVLQKNWRKSQRRRNMSSQGYPAPTPH